MLPKLPAPPSVKGFTLVELLVVIAIIGIVVAGVVVTLNPVKRINDAQVSTLSAQTAAVGYAYEICLNYVDISARPIVQNTPADCGYLAGGNSNITTVLSSSTPPPSGGPFLKTPPTTGTFQLVGGGGSNPNGCILGVSGGFWALYVSSTNAVAAGTSTPVGSCPTT